MEINKTGPALYRRLPLLVMTLLLAACTPKGDATGQPEVYTKGGSMHTAAQAKPSELATPPIDETAPAVFETATFGLG